MTSESVCIWLIGEQKQLSERRGKEYNVVLQNLGCIAICNFSPACIKAQLCHQEATNFVGRKLWGLSPDGKLQGLKLSLSLRLQL